MAEKGIIRAIILACASAVLINLLFVDLMVIQGRSMLPTLQPGSLVVVNRAAYGFRIPGMNGYLVRWGSPRPGDVVVFYTPFGERAVKRSYSITPEGAIFVRGDNHYESLDSRDYGAIVPDHIVGRVVSFRRGGL